MSLEEGYILQHPDDVLIINGTPYELFWSLQITHKEKARRYKLELLIRGVQNPFSIQESNSILWVQAEGGYHHFKACYNVGLSHNVKVDTVYAKHTLECPAAEYERYLPDQDSQLKQLSETEEFFEQYQREGECQAVPF